MAIIDIIRSIGGVLDQQVSKLIVAVVIILVGFILGRVVSRLIGKLAEELKVDALFEKTGIKISLSATIAQLFAYLIYFVAIILAFDKLGLANAIIYALSIAALVLIIFSTFLAIKDFMPNFFAGMKIYQRQIFNVGDKIKVKNIEAIVTKITLTETQMKTRSGDILYIQNAALLKSSFSVRKRK